MHSHFPSVIGVIHCSNTSLRVMQFCHAGKRACKHKRIGFLVGMLGFSLCVFEAGYVDIPAGVVGFVVMAKRGMCCLLVCIRDICRIEQWSACVIKNDDEIVDDVVSHRDKKRQALTH